MKVTVIDSATGKRHAALVAESGKHVTIDRCPVCDATPGVIAGIRGTMTRDHDTYRADAATICCDTRIGTIETRVETFFGIAEDEAMMGDGHRCRIYGGGVDAK